MASDPPSENPRKKDPKSAVYRYAREKYEEYAPTYRAAIQSTCAYCRTQYQKYRGWENLKKFVEVGTLVGLWAYVVLTYRILDVNRLTLIAGQRSFVYIDKIDVDWANITEIKEKKYLDVTIYLGNSGNTSTIDLRAVTTCDPIGPSIPRDPFSRFRWDEKKVARFVIAPRQTLKFRACRIPENELASVQMGFGRRYFMGEIRYYDFIEPGIERITQFEREFVVHSLDSGAGKIDYEVPIVGLHNCADDECQNVSGDPGPLAAPIWQTY